MYATSTFSAFYSPPRGEYRAPIRIVDGREAREHRLGAPPRAAAPLCTTYSAYPLFAPLNISTGCYFTCSISTGIAICITDIITQRERCNYGSLERKYRAILHGSTTDCTAASACSQTTVKHGRINGLFCPCLCILSRPAASTKYVIKKYVILSPAVLNDYLCNNLYIFLLATGKVTDSIPIGIAICITDTASIPTGVAICITDSTRTGIAICITDSIPTGVATGITGRIVHVPAESRGTLVVALTVGP